MSDSSQKPFFIRILVPNGDPDGLRVVEKSNWPGVTQDQASGAPSTAAAVVLGRTANGRIEWKNQAGQTLKEVQTLAAGVVNSSEP